MHNKLSLDNKFINQI